MTHSSAALASVPATFFAYCAGKLEIRNGEGEDFLGLSSAQWLEIARNGWKKLVPEEFHSEVQQLADLPVSESYRAVEFPVAWGRATLWLRFVAVAMPEDGGKKKIVGLVQDITRQRQMPFAEEDSVAPQRDEHENGEEEAWQELRHKLSAPLTSILLHCDLLLESECAPDTRQRLETILSEALRIDHYLRSMPAR